MPLLWRASFGYLLRHPWQLILALAGITVGVAVIVAVDLANESSRRAFEMSVDAVNGEATHQISAGPAGVDEELYVSLRLQRGISSVAPVVDDWLEAGGRTLQMLGLDAFAERGFRGYLPPGAREVDIVSEPGGSREAVLRRLLTEPGAVLLAPRTAAALGISPGDSFEATVRGRTVEATLVGVLGADSDRRLDDLVVTDVATAQEWLGQRGQLSRIDVRAPPGEEGKALLERLADALPEGVRLLPAAARTQSVSDMSSAFMTNLSAMSLLALLVAVFLIYNSVAFAVLQRRGLIGVLRALGLTRRQTLALILFEAFLLASVGVGLGLSFGIWLGSQLLALVSQSINDLYFVVHVTEITVRPMSVAKGVAAGLGATLLAATVPALEAASWEPRLALTRSALERRTGRALPAVAAAGVLMALAALALILVSGSSLIAGLVALFLLIFGLALCIPVLARGAAALCAPALGRAGGLVARIAVAGVGASLSRTGVAIVALAVAVSATVGVGTMVDSFRSSVTGWLENTLRADIYVGVGTGPLDDDLAAELVQLPGVAEFSTSRRVWLQTEVGLTRLTAIRIAPESYAGVRLLDAEPGPVWPEFEDEGAVLVSDSYAWRHDVGRGGTVTLPTRRGERVFPIASTYQSYDADLDAVVMSRRTYDIFWEDDAIDSLGLYLQEGADPERVMALLRAASEGRQALVVRSNAALRDQSMQVFDRTFRITDVLYWLAVAVAVIGILGALLALQLERIAELAVLRALGATPRQVAGMVATQAGFIGLVSGLAALPLGLVMSFVLIEVINRRAFGWQLEMLLAPWPLLGAVALAVAMSLLAAVYPAWRAARVNPARAMREE
jgi:putative ABC transport system permease protein